MTSASDWADLISPSYFKEGTMIDIRIVYDELNREFEDITLPDVAHSIKMLNIALTSKGLPIIKYSTNPIALECEDNRFNLIIFFCKALYYRYIKKYNESEYYDNKFIRETLSEKREIANLLLEEENQS